MPDLEWLATATADLVEIVDHISDDNPDAAQALKDEIEEKVARLPENPRLYRVGRVAGTHEMVVRPSYVVVYAETSETVSVLRVLHTARQWSEI